MPSNTLTFVFQGQVWSLPAPPPDTTLLQLLREHMRHSACKEGCGEGDCGACTVVVAQLDTHSAEQAQENLHYQAVNACIRLAHSIQGQALWTAGTIAPVNGGLHPVQQALVEHHASQCGFCTPGFVMSLFAYYQNTVVRGIKPNRSSVEAALDGNLCRCTGYQPILHAALHLADYPKVEVDTAVLIKQLRDLQTVEQEHNSSQSSASTATASTFLEENCYLRPQTLSELLRLRRIYPQAQVVAGCTDVGLWITKGGRRFNQVLDVSACSELQTHYSDEYGQHLGAALSLEKTFAILSESWPQLQGFFQRFAGRPVRNAGTLGGNIANGSPIGDSMPLLLALNAEISLTQQGPSEVETRRMALADFYTGYRQNQMQATEVLSWVHIPQYSPSTSQGPIKTLLQAYKVSKRTDDDISAVCFAMCVDLDSQHKVLQARIGLGGVAATPTRAPATEALLQGKTWSQALIDEAKTSLQAEFKPISDMRASADYRRAMLGQLLQRFYLASQEQQVSALDLAQLSPSAAHPATAKP